MGKLVLAKATHEELKDQALKMITDQADLAESRWRTPAYPSCVATSCSSRSCSLDKRTK
jgi:hypothetical protein